MQLTAGAFEGSQVQGLSLNAFLKWSKQLPALPNSLKSLLAAGSIDIGNAPASAVSNVSGACVHQYPGHVFLASIVQLNLDYMIGTSYSESQPSIFASHTVVLVQPSISHLGAPDLCSIMAINVKPYTC